jgi:hypothetical protein
MCYFCLMLNLVVSCFRLRECLNVRALLRCLPLSPHCLSSRPRGSVCHRNLKMTSLHTVWVWFFMLHQTVTLLASSLLVAGTCNITIVAHNGLPLFFPFNCCVTTGLSVLHLVTLFCQHIAQDWRWLYNYRLQEMIHWLMATLLSCKVVGMSH